MLRIRSYINEDALNKFYEKHGIVPEKISNNHNVCSIGYSDKEKKWYGWSHRSICGFGVGDKIFDKNFGDDDTHFLRHRAKTIKNMSDAKIAAINFAKYVS